MGGKMWYALWVIAKCSFNDTDLINMNLINMNELRSVNKSLAVPGYGKEYGDRWNAGI